MKIKNLILGLLLLTFVNVNGQTNDWILTGEKLNEESLFAEAINPFLNAYQLSIEQEDSLGIVRTSLGLGYSYINQHKISESISYYQSAYNISNKKQWLQEEKEAADALSSMLFLTGQPQAAIPYAERCVELGLVLNDEFFYSTKLMELGYLYFQVGIIDSADLYLHKALEVKQKINDITGTVIVQNYLGEFYKGIGDLEKAQDLNFLNLNYWQKQNDSIKQITSYFNIANIFFEMGDFVKAEKYARESLTLSEQLNLVIYKSFGLKTLAAINVINGKTQLALSQYHQLIDIYKITDHKTRMSDVLLKIATIHLDLGELIEAKKYIQEAIYYVKQTEDVRTKIKLNLVQSKIARREGKHKIALQEAKTAYDLAINGGFQSESVEASLLVSEAYSDLNNAILALNWHKKHSILKDSLSKTNQQNSIHELETKYRVNQKQEEILKLNAEKELSELRLKSASRNQMLLIIGILLLTLLAALSYFFYQTKKRDNILLEEKNQIIKVSLNEKELLVQEIHHRVKNNLQTISSLLNMQTYKTDHPEALAAIKKGEARIKSMTLIHENLFMSDDGVNLKASEYIRKLTLNLFETYNIRPEKIKLKLDIEDVTIDLDRMIALGLILNELISNSLKYAFINREEGIIEVKLTNKIDKINLQVKDNGSGIPENFREKNSLGFQIIHDFVKKLKGDIIVNKNDGTDININIPRNI